MDEETQERVREWLNRAKENLRAAKHEFDGEFYARAISTSYYAMFYAATGALASIGIDRAKHSGIVSAFGEHFARSGKVSRELGQILNQTMQDREESDYDAVPIADHDLAQKRLDDANRFVSEVEAYLKEHGLTDA